MTRQEVQMLLGVIASTFPNSSLKDLGPKEQTETVNAWFKFLEDKDGGQIGLALKSYINTSGSGFPPSVSQLIALTAKPAELNQLTDAQAWGIVRKAIANGIYNSEAEFAKFPEAIKTAVGCPEQLYIWATDSEYNESVISSNFKRAYRTTLERQREINLLPPEVKALVMNTADRLGGATW